jgi:HAD superfamily hydrolase (TIGR01484 family)
MPPAPLAEADLSRVTAVFTDVDGTLTTADRLRSETVKALESLAAAGIRPVLVTGRPAGWAEAWARTLPVEGVIAENGGLYFARRARGHLVKVYAQPLAARRSNRARLLREVSAAIKGETGARLSSDSAYTEVDLAIDHSEEARLSTAAVDRLEARLTRRGITAVRSSVHLNCWIGRFNKLTAARAFLKREWRLTLQPSDPRFAYAGDSLNDAPLFGAFSLSVGVANVMRVADRLPHLPAFITPSPEGKGFEELSQAILAARKS